MSILDYFLQKRKKTAVVAKDRLQIILAHERANRNGPDYLPALQREILEVVKKYVKVDADQVQIKLDREGDCEVLELNITLPETLPEQAVQSG